jgi:pyruvate/2-oxoacid:ferredoxin oxidoreductase beta subunit
MIADKDIKWLTQMIIDAIKHPGFAHINVQQACPTWKKR